MNNEIYNKKGRVISTNGKEEDIIKEKYKVEIKCIKNKRRRLHIPQRNNNMI